MKKYLIAVSLFCGLVAPAFAASNTVTAASDQPKSKFCSGLKEDIIAKCVAGDVIQLKTMKGNLGAEVFCDLSKQFVLGLDGKPSACVYIGYMREVNYF